ncbi:hypothetical protein PTSG_10565 [Salpingoeca rosetta]|uniref:Uncharacterized protein n=1 Tax=Salpingoeca rosetta (strain ATCC 50818 / BSB-021) TaxID=946362 RepID=F2URQ5_SALR5|nr:uncharacterized protein PTSG_10565 [Salpingoeca rosetta]EGD80310.1 hypothetical protein PTSG_10565 [Salpingoeca rosetta]|eukprot:XP_004988100.1 hypothetical protein PTSG_10565 [Salpingoeca rosetta]
MSETSDQAPLSTLSGGRGVVTLATTRVPPTPLPSLLVDGNDGFEFTSYLQAVHIRSATLQPSRHADALARTIRPEKMAAFRRIIKQYVASSGDTAAPAWRIVRDDERRLASVTPNRFLVVSNRKLLKDHGFVYALPLDHRGRHRTDAFYTLDHRERREDLCIDLLLIHATAAFHIIRPVTWIRSYSSHFRHTSRYNCLTELNGIQGNPEKQSIRRDAHAQVKRMLGLKS